jgi:glycosyltransferase involved in cell wall biosynthesis
MFFERVGLQQRVLPSYRVSFIDMLASVCPNGLGVFAGKPLPKEEIHFTDKLSIAAYTEAVNWHIFDPSSSLYLCWQWGIRRWLYQYQPKVLIVEANPRYLSTRLAIQWMHERNRPVIGWGLGAPPIPGRFGKLRNWERKSFFLSLDAIISYSQSGAWEYSSLGFPSSRVFIAPNAVMPKPDAPIPHKYSLRKTDKPTVLFIGRLQERKRVDNLLYSCASLPVDIQPNLIIVGDGPARASLESLAGQIYPQTIFTGSRHGQELNVYFNQADLFVLPGTGGLAIQEAMAHGLPIIVAEGDGTQDALVRPENGWLIPPGNKSALSHTMKEALSNKKRLRQMGEKSYRIVTQEVNLEKMVEAFIKALESVT